MTDDAIKILDRLEDRLDMAVAACSHAAVEIRAQRRALRTLTEAIEAEGYRVLVHVSEPGMFTIERGKELDGIYEDAWRYRSLCR